MFHLALVGFFHFEKKNALEVAPLTLPMGEETNLEIQSWENDSDGKFI